MKHIKTFEQYANSELTNEENFFKKLVGQLKEWKLDGSYINKASDDAKNYVANHPAAKTMISSIKSKLNLTDEQAKEAVLHIKDWGGKPDPNNMSFDKETLMLKLEPKSGAVRPSVY
jgi:hypothetical protein